MLAQCCYSTFILHLGGLICGQRGFQCLAFCQHFARSLPDSIPSPMVTEPSIDTEQIQLMVNGSVTQFTRQTLVSILCPQARLTA